MGKLACIALNDTSLNFHCSGETGSLFAEQKDSSLSPNECLFQPESGQRNGPESQCDGP
jgi:hypothetical protein